MSKSPDTILQGRIAPPLIRFTLPMMLSLLIQALYGAVDLMVVGKFGSTASVAAVSNGSQIMHTITGVIAGLGMGSTVLVGTDIGAQDKKGAADTVGAMIKLFSVLAAVITACAIIFAPHIARAMQVPAEAVAGTVIYLRVCGAGTIFIVAYNAISCIFRGIGDSKSPLIAISIACVVNIAGDLILCGIFGMDLFGAALATVFAQIVSVMLFMYRIKHGGWPFRITAENMKNSWNKIRQIIKIGLPISMQEVLVSVSFLIITAIINDISLVASASIGIAEKLFLFLAIVPMSFTSSLSAFVAQNVGAKQELRAQKAVGISLIISFAFGVCMACLTYFGGGMLARIFEKNPDVILSTHEYLRVVSLEYVIVSIVFCLLGYFNGIGKTTFVMLEAVLSAFLVRIPLSYYFSRLPNTDLRTIGFAVPIAAVVSLILCVAYYFHVRKKRAVH